MVDDQEVVQHDEGYNKENNNTYVLTTLLIIYELISQFVDCRKRRNGILYAPRNSLLTDLFKEKHHRTAYYTFIAISLNLSLNAFIDSYISEQR